MQIILYVRFLGTAILIPVHVSKINSKWIQFETLTTNHPVNHRDNDLF
jgi:hypothetical protein